MTAICEPCKAFYMDIPRTGSMGMLRILEKHYGGVNVEQIRPTIPEGYFTFHTVRDPYTRAVSIWQYFKDDDRYPEFESMMSESPASFITECVKRHGDHSFRGFPLIMNQCDHLRFRHNVEFADGYVHIESYAEDFQALPFYNGSPVEFPKVNPSTDCGVVMDSNFIQAVNAWAAEDFERFGYEV